MKKTVCALMIGGLLPIVSQGAVIYQHNDNQLDLYGRITGTGYMSANKTKQGDHTFARLGIKGKTQIYQQLGGYGHWEAQINANQPESAGSRFLTRFAYAGLNFGQAGSLDYGRNNGILFDISGWTNGYWTGNLPGMGIDTYENQDNFMVKRSNNLLTYRNHDLSGVIPGLNIGLQYQGKNDGWNNTEHQPLSSNPRGVAHQNGDGYGISASYKTPIGFSFGGALARSQRTLEQAQDGLGNNARGWNVGVKYDKQSVYLAATYANTSNMTWFKNRFIHEVNNYELVAKYKFSNGLQPLIVYSHSRANQTGKLNHADLVHYVNVGVDYVFNKNFLLFADYKINLINKENAQKADADNVLALGASYKF